MIVKLRAIFAKVRLKLYTALHSTFSAEITFVGAGAVFHPTVWTELIHNRLIVVILFNSLEQLTSSFSLPLYLQTKIYINGGKFQCRKPCIPIGSHMTVSDVRWMVDIGGLMQSTQLIRLHTSGHPLPPDNGEVVILTTFPATI